jgi:Cellulose biosynthesis protein BcsS
MRKINGTAMAVVLAVALSIAASQALAGTESNGDDQARFLLFSNSDLWRHGGFTHAGALWAPRGLDREGPVLKLMFGGGVYHYIPGALGGVDIRGIQLAGAVLPGWRFMRDGFIITVFVGYDFQSHRLAPDDPSAGLRGDYIGMRTGFELWYEPTPTTMLTADASISTIGPSYSARLAAGWRMFGRFYLGPELQAFAADDNYGQVRGGLHVTGLRLDRFEWSAGVGWANDSDHRDGAYGKLGVLTRL